MKRRTQTTFTFSRQSAAEIFAYWLKRNENDRDYGYPKLVNTREVADAQWCVEYSYERDFARGVATGIDLVSR